ncbi:hypothetical protein [Phenylobacterium sp.]|jgi:hypothetical protein|uniref:hypothetical protein n=1 Tax=Phenylobacterium sp. TaxID=1871053 RepID=UPI0035ADFF4D
MKKMFVGALAAVTAAAAVASVAAPAQAEPYRYGRRDHNNNDAAAAAVVGGIVGLALGAAIAGSNKDRRYDNGYYRQGYYDNGYYNNGYYQGGGYGAYGDSYYRGYNGYGGAYASDYGRRRVCVSRDRVYDPYVGRRVTVERRYAC